MGCSRLLTSVSNSCQFAEFADNYLEEINYAKNKTGLDSVVSGAGARGRGRFHANGPRGGAPAESILKPHGPPAGETAGDLGLGGAERESYGDALDREP